MTKPRSVAATANDNSIPGSKLVDSSITGNKIENETISQDKFAPSVSFPPADASITDAKVALDAAIASSKLSYSPSGTGSVTSRSVQDRLGEMMSVFDFIPESEHAAIRAGTSTYDCTDDLNAAFAAWDGLLYMPEGTYRVTAPLLIRHTAPGNASESYNLIAPRARILFDFVQTPGIASLFFNDCKRVNIDGLVLRAVGSDHMVGVSGLWRSKWVNMEIGMPTMFGYGPEGGFDSHYWNNFDTCSFNGGLIFDTGTGSARKEFNMNSFSNCNIFGGDYAISLYGDNTSFQGVYFFACDLSYQTAGILYVDEQRGGNLTFYGGYLDSSAGFPRDTKGVNVNIQGPMMSPNGAADGSFLLSQGSNMIKESELGVRGSRIYPMSSQNFIKNGDLGAGTDYVIADSGVSLSMVAGDGLYGQVLRASATTNFRSVDWVTVPLPMTGHYTLAVMGKLVSGSYGAVSQVGSNPVLYGTISLGSDMTLDSFSFFAQAGDVYKISFDTSNLGGFTIDFAYVGVTFGGIGQLMTPPSPTASPVRLQNISAPTHTPADGGLLFVEGGALKFRGSSGTVTTIAPA